MTVNQTGLYGRESLELSGDGPSGEAGASVQRPYSLGVCLLRLIHKTQRSPAGKGRAGALGRSVLNPSLYTGHSTGAEILPHEAVTL